MLIPDRIWRPSARDLADVAGELFDGVVVATGADARLTASVHVPHGRTVIMTSMQLTAIAGVGGAGPTFPEVVFLSGGIRLDNGAITAGVGVRERLLVAKFYSSGGPLAPNPPGPNPAGERIVSSGAATPGTTFYTYDRAQKKTYNWSGQLWIPDSWEVFVTADFLNPDAGDAAALTVLGTLIPKADFQS